MPERFSVQVEADQFDRLARPTQPLAGVAEMVWNALDAEAEVVAVVIERTELDGVDTVMISDDGHGMSRGDALRDFKRLGGLLEEDSAAVKEQQAVASRSRGGRPVPCFRHRSVR